MIAFYRHPLFGNRMCPRFTSSPALSSCTRQQGWTVTIEFACWRAINSANEAIDTAESFGDACGNAANAMQDFGEAFSGIDFGDDECYGDCDVCEDRDRCDLDIDGGGE